MDYQRKNHSKFLIIYHIIFVVKYRTFTNAVWGLNEMCYVKNSRKIGFCN
jgi:REP element-mobilizing transposase RayT